MAVTRSLSLRGFSLVVMSGSDSLVPTSGLLVAGASPLVGRGLEGAQASGVAAGGGSCGSWALRQAWHFGAQA